MLTTVALLFKAPYTIGNEVVQMRRTSLIAMLELLVNVFYLLVSFALFVCSCFYLYRFYMFLERP